MCLVVTLFEWHMRICKELGTVGMNVQILTNGADGRMVTNKQVADFYVWAAEVGDCNGVVPSLEVHVNQWSEHFGRVAAVGKIVEERGVPFKLTLDHSHVIFKIDNPREQEIQGMRADVESGKLELDPFKPNNVISQWIDKNWIAHIHARPTVPNNPVNLWATTPDGSFGRGIQYPFVKPAPGEWHSPWEESKLEPWKEVVRQVFRFHASSPESSLGQVTTEMLPGVHFGMGARYSIFDHSIEMAKWLRTTWDQIVLELHEGDRP
jgi:hypothetical protein